MNRNGHQDAEFFLGREVEHTPAYGMYTLFVIGCQPKNKIFAHLDSIRDTPIEHVYLGANHSFPRNITTNDFAGWRPWEELVDSILDRDLYCTLDININQIEGLLETSFCENNKFIPMISAPLPYIKLLGYNAVLKIDDIDFDKTNPGIWCHSIHSLTHRDQFTPWSAYAKDQVL
jgi:hypothetical protein